jgi:hypothetical protein
VAEAIPQTKTEALREKIQKEAGKKGATAKAAPVEPPPPLLDPDAPGADLEPPDEPEPPKTTPKRGQGSLI